jgi:hypothetical protein
MDLLLLLWLLLDNAEALRDACLFAVAAVSWLAAGGLGLFVMWFFR